VATRLLLSQESNTTRREVRQAGVSPPIARYQQLQEDHISLIHSSTISIHVTAIVHIDHITVDVSLRDLLSARRYLDHRWGHNGVIEHDVATAC